jgi:hypothetical protein
MTPPNDIINITANEVSDIRSLTAHGEEYGTKDPD